MKKGDIHQPATMREQIIFVVVIFVVWLVLFNTFMKPEKTKLANLKKKVVELNQEKKELVNFAQATPVLEKTISLSRKKGIKAKIVLGDLKPISEDLSFVLQYLIDSTLGPGLEFKDVTSSPKVSQKGYSIQPFKVKILGEYNPVIQYFERLEQFPALFQLNAFEMKVSSDQPQNLDVEYSGSFYKIEPGMNPVGVANTGAKK